jgi:hypothetical protein
MMGNDIHGNLQDPSNRTDVNQRTAEQEQGPPEPITTLGTGADPNPPPSASHQDTTCEKHTKRLRKAKPWIEFIGLIVLIVYTSYAGCQTAAVRESNRINREALESVQRAFMVCDGIVAGRFAVVQNKVTQGINGFAMGCENTGATPANLISEAFVSDKFAIIKDASTIPEPAEKQFIGIKQDRFTSVVGPRSPWRVAGVRKSDKDVFQRDLPIFNSDIAKLPPFDSKPMSEINVFWGWLTYRDVFPGTKLHVTEFCRQLTASTVTSDPANPTAHQWSSCRHHNCSDEYCDDYKDIVAMNPDTKK